MTDRYIRSATKFIKAGDRIHYTHSGSWGIEAAVVEVKDDGNLVLDDGKEIRSYLVSRISTGPIERLKKSGHPAEWVSWEGHHYRYSHQKHGIAVYHGGEDHSLIVEFNPETFTHYLLYEVSAGIHYSFHDDVSDEPYLEFRNLSETGKNRELLVV